MTSTPNAFQAVANSMPTAPEPSTIAFFGSFVEVQRVVGGDDPLAVELGEGQLAGLGAGRDDDRGRLTVRVSPSSTSTSTVSVAVSRPVPMMVSTPRPLSAPWRPFHILSTTASLCCVERLDLDALVVERDAEVGGVLGVLGDLGGLQDRLGRDAAPVQAGPADLLASR